MSGCRGDAGISAAARTLGRSLDNAETVVGFFDLDQAGCSAKVGSVKNSVRNNDLLGCDRVSCVAVLGASGTLKAGNVPAGLNSF